MVVALSRMQDQSRSRKKKLQEKQQRKTRKKNRSHRHRMLFRTPYHMYVVTRPPASAANFQYTIFVCVCVCMWVRCCRCSRHSFDIGRLKPKLPIFITRKFVWGTFYLTAFCCCRIVSFWPAMVCDDNGKTAIRRRHELNQHSATDSKRIRGVGNCLHAVEIHH